MEGWNGQVTQVRAWLIIEIGFFFMWILSSVLFLFLSYVFKFKSVAKTEAMQLMDQNVWNDSDTDDFLRYLKFEYFLLTFMICFIGMEILCGFFKNSFYNMFGQNTIESVNTIFLLIVMVRILNLMITAYRFKEKRHLQVQHLIAKYDDDVDIQEDERDKEAARFSTFRYILHFLVVAAVIYIFIQNDQLKNQNMIAKLWIHAEMISLVLDWPYIIIQLYMMMSRQKRIKAEFQRQKIGSEKDLDEQKKEHLRKMQLMAQDKSKLEFDDDFFTLTCLSYLKQNHEQWALAAQKQSQMLYSCLIVALLVLAMLVCMVYEMFERDDEPFCADFKVFFVKFPCAFALHFAIYPEVAKGLNIMKFSNNQADQFVVWGSEVAYCLGFIQVATGMAAEVINIFILSKQTTVEFCIIYFVSLKVIMEVSNLYFHSLMDLKFKGIIKQPPKVVNRNRNLVFGDRSTFHQIARVFYKLVRGLYVSCVFYFVPFSVIFVQFFMTTKKQEQQ